MAKRIILLSGPVSSGKSTLGDTLVERYGFVRFKTQDLIRRLEGTDLDRLALQAAGERLDRKTDGQWVSKALANEVMDLPANSMVLVDAVRIPAQVTGIRTAFGHRVTHVHLTASPEELAARYAARNSHIRELASYAEVQANQTERKVERLADIAEIVVNTERTSPAEVMVRVAAHLGLYGRGYDRLVDVMIGGQYGSEGKGHVASFIAADYDVLVRVGGPNAGHKAYEEPEPYIFHHLPSGTRRNSSASIVLGPGAVIKLSGLQKEIADCQLSRDRLVIDPQAMIIEAEDVVAERGLVAGIGSTGQGVGAATVRKILRTIASPPVRLAKHVQELSPFIRDSREVFDDAFTHGKHVFLEGTQGTGLSLHHGDYPFVTSRDTTVGGCLAESGLAPGRVRRVIMVCRTYPIRVGNPSEGKSGPMIKELTLKDIHKRSGIPLEELERTERTSTTNRERRIAEFDWLLLRKAASLNAPTDIALSFTDYLSIKNRTARRFEQLTDETIRFIEEVERVATASVSLISTQFHFHGVIDRRAW